MVEVVDDLILLEKDILRLDPPRTGNLIIILLWMHCDCRRGW